MSATPFRRAAVEHHRLPAYQQTRTLSPVFLRAPWHIVVIAWVAVGIASTWPFERAVRIEELRPSGSGSLFIGEVMHRSPVRRGDHARLSCIHPLLGAAEFDGQVVDVAWTQAPRGQRIQLQPARATPDQAVARCHAVIATEGVAAIDSLIRWVRNPA